LVLLYFKCFSVEGEINEERRRLNLDYETGIDLSFSQQNQVKAADRIELIVFVAKTFLSFLEELAGYLFQPVYGLKCILKHLQLLDCLQIDLYFIFVHHHFQSVLVKGSVVHDFLEQFELAENYVLALEFSVHMTDYLFPVPNLSSSAAVELLIFGDGGHMNGSIRFCFDLLKDGFKNVCRNFLLQKGLQVNNL